MDAATATRLVDINREFYSRFGESFSATRRRIQPGVGRILERLKGEESILDLGCGNGELARELARRGHRGPYLGVDFSPPLLREAEAQAGESLGRFLTMDLTRLDPEPLSAAGPWGIVSAFAVLHHIPSLERRLDVLRIVHQLLREEGLFIHSSWQFLSSPKLKARIQPWEAADLPADVVDPGDYLLDWRGGGRGLRYVHQFEEQELGELARMTGFGVSETFYSDGDSGRLGLYQVWRPAR